MEVREGGGVSFRKRSALLKRVYSTSAVGRPRGRRGESGIYWMEDGGETQESWRVSDRMPLKDSVAILRPNSGARSVPRRRRCPTRCRGVRRSLVRDPASPILTWPCCLAGTHTKTAHFLPILKGTPAQPRPALTTPCPPLVNAPLPLVP